MPTHGGTLDTTAGYNSQYTSANAFTAPNCSILNKTVFLMKNSKFVSGPPRDLIAVGDIVASALEKIGVTKALVEKVTGTQGKPGGCGCQQRQNTLNQVGYVVQEKMHDGFDAAKQFMGLGE